LLVTKQPKKLLLEEFHPKGIDVEKWEPPTKDGLSVQVFIVRIWSEVRERPELPVELRGTIEHIPSGHKRYFTELNEMLAFLKAQLAHQGILLSIEPNVLQRLWRCVRRVRP
jgi:hypothetical protein